MKQFFLDLFKHNNNDSLSKKFRKGAIWVTGIGIFARGVNFVSAIVLTRLLNPEDFGLLAIATSIIAFSHGTTQTGFNAAIIQRQKEPGKFLNSAWSIEVLRGLILGVIIGISAPLFAYFFKDQRVTLILRVLCLTFIFTGLNNIGVIWFRKNLDFRKQFVFEVIPQVANVIIVIPLVFILRNVWALVIAGVSASAIRCLISYTMHPFRPKFDFNLNRIKELFNFGKWILSLSIINMIREQGLPMFIGKFFNFTILGFYNRACAFTKKIFFELIEILWRIGFPAFSQISNEITKLRKVFLIVLKVITFIGFPIAAGIFILSWEFTHFILTDKWIKIVPLIKILSLNAFIIVISAPVSISLQSLGKPSILTKISLINLIMVFLMIYPLAVQMGITGVILTIFLSNIITAPIGWYKLLRLLKIDARYFIMQILQPFSITIIMVIVIMALKTYLYPINSVFDLLIYILIGAITYIIFTFLFDKMFNTRFLLLFKSIIVDNFDYEKII